LSSGQLALQISDLLLECVDLLLGPQLFNQLLAELVRIKLRAHALL